ncbi:DNA/RNA non-specific endonuclease [Hallella multisaccharivorax DSM 17128]|uniref:DNA/RNA non-specific endonuclease n=1 Tax=Hallella multisaccharivorax DSM 17128 TaxID=688246 RepID=F8N7I7_9BACT|nr:DNA/RNA non-specific endonuclease [Hallella multisaccharivorax]EGN57447.1 DNA/RNA non-specific endonuclease [Hallella multisaccharivorax DSM 17128]
MDKKNLKSALFFVILFFVLLFAIKRITTDEPEPIPETSSSGISIEKSPIKDKAPTTRLADTDSKTSDSTSNASIEIPVFTKRFQSQILKRYSYTVSYNKDTRCPNWVAWKLIAQHTEGPYNRSGYKFHEDMEVPYPRAYYQDYKGSPYDMQRGHMCPAADNKWSDRAMDECHLMTNICPQYGDLNEGDWKDLEDACRDWARTYDCIYIVCGPIFTSGHHRTIGEDNILVPDAFFKVILRLGNNPQALGFIYPNKACSGNMSTYVMSVDEVEKVAGMDFFSTLNDKIESKVERTSNLGEWSN